MSKSNRYEDLPDTIQRTISTAEKYQKRVNKLLASSEKSPENQLKALLHNPVDRNIFFKIIDQGFRTKNTKRIAELLIYLFDRYGIPSFISKQDRAMLWLAGHSKRGFPDMSVASIMKKISYYTGSLLLSGEEKAFHKHVMSRKKQKFMMNINYVGKAIHGEDEVHQRINRYRIMLEDPSVEHVSIKISTLFSQLNVFAFEETLSVLVDRLTRLFVYAQKEHFIDHRGQKCPKFISLDMEEYCYGELTIEAFMRTLEQPELNDFSAGITLQAYQPEYFTWQKIVTEWAQKRVNEGGKPIKLRIVKGAHLEMERIEAEHHNWPLVLYNRKLDVDANFKRMIEYGLEPSRARCVHIGAASHNLFDLAFAQSREIVLLEYI